MITGAGIGGLVAALALQQRGFEVALYEQAHDLREVGAGVQISPNGTRVLYSLGLADAIRAVAVEPTGKEVRLWNSGATWPLFDLGPTCVARYGSPYLMFHRGDLQMALVKAVREANPAAIHLGASVTQSTETEDGVVIDLVDGRTIAGSLLVGADGVHSTTRSALFGTARIKAPLGPTPPRSDSTLKLWSTVTFQTVPLRGAVSLNTAPQLNAPPCGVTP